MQLAGLGARDVVGLLRDARHTAESSAPLVVTGILASELARALGAGSELGGAVHTGGEPEGAAALVVVLGGAATADDERRMRAAARARVPVVAVQTDARTTTPLPYVPSSSVVVCPPGQGFPVDEIARVLGRRLGNEAVPLAARLPALRPGIVEELVRRASLHAAVIGALPWRRGAAFPVLTLIQARLVLDIAAVHGRRIDQERAPDLAAVAGAGLGVRAIIRRLPVRLPLAGGITGYVTTRALGEAALRRFTSSG